MNRLSTQPVANVTKSTTLCAREKASESSFILITCENALKRLGGLTLDNYYIQVSVTYDYFNNISLSETPEFNSF